MITFWEASVPKLSSSPPVSVVIFPETPDTLYKRSPGKSEMFMLSCHAGLPKRMCFQPGSFDEKGKSEKISLLVKG
jgi:hypothetical protein